MRRPLRPLAACVLCVAAACGTPVVSVQVSLSTRACDGALADPGRDPAAGVDTLRILVSGDGLSVPPKDVPFNQLSAQIPSLPLGKNRRIVIEALKAGLLRAVADSGRFDVLSGGDVQLSLQLRVVDAFTLTGPPGGGACSHLVTPRVGHAMALLPDGRVLITGGFTINPNGSLNYLRSAELYDPQAGTFTLLSAPPAYGRAGHAALPVTLGQSGASGVLILGGQGPTDAAQSGLPQPIAALELFTAGAWQLPGQLDPGREHQTALVDVQTGYAVLAGGINGPETGVPNTTSALDLVTFYDPVAGRVSNATERLRLPLWDAAGVSRSNGGRGGVVLLGGRTRTGDASDQIVGAVYDSGSYVHDPLFADARLAKLPAPRVRHFAVRLGDDTVLVVGGLGQASSTIDAYPGATAAVTLVDPAGFAVADLAQLSVARADGCGALLEDGTTLFAGGAFNDGQRPHSSSVAEVLDRSQTSDKLVRTLQGPQSGSWGLQIARHRAACLRLRDGSVLVTGGLQFSEGTGAGQSVLDSAEVYRPVAPR